MSGGKTFALAWLDAVAAADVDTAAKAVALAMATHANYATGENMRAGTARLAHMAGIGDRRCREMIGQLRDAGLIQWDGVPTAPGRARVYLLTIPNGGGIVPVSPRERRQRSATVRKPTAAVSDRNGGTIPPQRRQQGATQQSQNKALNSVRETPAALTRDGVRADDETADEVDVDPTAVRRIVTATLALADEARERGLPCTLGDDSPEAVADEVRENLTVGKPYALSVEYGPATVTITLDGERPEACESVRIESNQLDPATWHPAAGAGWALRGNDAPYLITFRRFGHTPLTSACEVIDRCLAASAEAGAA